MTDGHRLWGYKKFADDNFEKNNGKNLGKGVENAEGKGEIARYEQLLLFPVFSRDLFCRHVKKKYGLLRRMKL